MISQGVHHPVRSAVSRACKGSWKTARVGQGGNANGFSLHIPSMVCLWVEVPFLNVATKAHLGSPAGHPSCLPLAGIYSQRAAC